MITTNSMKHQCKHKYIAGYSFRTPGIFFRNVPCDECKLPIKLILPWRIVYGIVFFVMFYIGIELSSIVTDFLALESNILSVIIEVLILIIFLGIADLIQRIILRFGKWIEA